MDIEEFLGHFFSESQINTNPQNGCILEKLDISQLKESFEVLLKVFN